MVNFLESKMLNLSRYVTFLLPFKKGLNKNSLLGAFLSNSVLLAVCIYSYFDCVYYLLSVSTCTMSDFVYYLLSTSIDTLSDCCAAHIGTWSLCITCCLYL